MTTLRSILRLVPVLTACLAAATADARTPRIFADDGPLPTTITLRPVVRVPPDAAEITLGQLAQVSGPRAAALSGLKVRDLDMSSGWISVSADEVRDAVFADRAIDQSSVSIIGLSSQVRRVEKPAPPRAEPPDTAPEAPDVPDDRPTVRRAITDRLATLVSAGSDELRLRFDDRDRAALDELTTGRVVDIQSLGTADRLPVAVRLYEGERLVLNTTLRVGVEVRRPAAVAARALKRGQTLGPGDFVAEPRWLPLTSRAVDPAEADGQALRSGVKPGAVLTSDDVQPPIVVRKGELVNVHTLTGGFVLKLTCRALADGRDGEPIAFETLEGDRRRRRTVIARVSGPGTAIIAGPAEPESPAPEIVSLAPAAP